MTTKQIEELYKEYVMPTYGRLPIAFCSGSGAKLTDVNGKVYLDFLSGIAVNNLGNSHPRVVEAITEQARQLTHTSNLFLIEPQARLAETLINNCFPGKVFFCNSGAEANEAAIKLVRKWGQPQNKFEIITALQSFHGRTLTTITATGQEKYQKSFTPLPPGFNYIPYNDLDAAAAAITESTAAIMVEPIQGEGGVNIPAPDYLAGLRELCTKKGILLVLDEVQTGLGRTGKLFAFQHTKIIPDIITLAKALGNGVPIGAMIAESRIADVLQPGDHAATFGGNYLSSAAALATLEVILEEKLCDRAATSGQYLIEKLKNIANYDFVKDISGIGLMVRMELTFPGKEIVDKCLEQGLIINCIQDKVLRCLPPLNVTEAEIDQAVAILAKILQDIKNET